jgi:hypothetical protein
MNTTFDLAVEKTGPEYLGLEADLRRSARSGSQELESIRKHLTSPDPLVRLLATVLLDWAGAKESDFKSALEYLERLPVETRKTIVRVPSPTGTESYLTLRFGDRVTELLALRLVKEQDWPQWKVLAVIFYLKAHKVPSTTSALIRFAITTTNDKWRGFALEALREIKDPELSAKLAIEVTRARKLEQPVPADVRTLTP